MDNQKILNRLRKVENDLTKALKEMPNNSPAWEALAEIKALADKLERTIEHRKNSDIIGVSLKC